MTQTTQPIATDWYLTHCYHCGRPLTDECSCMDDPGVSESEACPAAPEGWTHRLVNGACLYCSKVDRS